MSLTGDRWARTSDIEITSPTLTRHRHTSIDNLLHTCSKLTPDWSRLIQIVNDIYRDLY